MQSIKQTPAYAFGDQAQQAFSQYLRQLGAVVVPLFNYGTASVDNAALLLDRDGSFPAPDLLALTPDRGRAWYEIKSKTRPDFWMDHRAQIGRWEHGCELHRARAYQRANAGGLPVFIVVRESSSPIDPSSNSPLRPGDTWLIIPITAAFRLGEIRPNWPSGPGSCGGLLWPRSAMQPWIPPDPGGQTPPYAGLAAQ